jgi:hypothetical protein
LHDDGLAENGVRRTPHFWQGRVSREGREGGEGERLFPSLFFASFARHIKFLQTMPSTDFSGARQGGGFR